MFLFKAALGAAFLLLLVQMPAAAECLEKGGFPFETGVDACLSGATLNTALAYSRGPTPPANDDGQGAPRGYVWQDSSTSPETLRKCTASPNCTGGVYHADEWETVGWDAPLLAQISQALGGTPFAGAVSWADITGTPTTLGGYGISDALEAAHNLSELSGSAATARGNLGLGSMATQSAGAVAITGGSITGMPDPTNPGDVATKQYVDDSGTTYAAGTGLHLTGNVFSLATGAAAANLGYMPLDPADNLSGLASPATARGNLGLDSMATQSAGAVAITGGHITGMPSPIDSSDVATKSYVDGTTSGLTVHATVAVATTTALPDTPTYANGTSGVGATLTASSDGVLTIDGYAVNPGDRVLVKDQAAAAAQNGVYTLTTAGTVSVPYVLTRATDFDQTANITANSYFFVAGGTANAGSGWMMTTGGGVTVGTTAIDYIQFSSSTTYSAGTGLDLTGTVFSLTTGAAAANLGYTPLNAASNLSDLGNASAARGSLGLGSLATQSAGSVAITGGSITGMPAPTGAADVATKGYVDNAGTVNSGSAGQVAYYAGAGKAVSGAPTSSLFDSAFCSAVGSWIVRLTGTWSCAKGVPANPVWWGADPSGASDSTAAFSAALAASSYVLIPPGTYKLASALSYTMSGPEQSLMLAGSGQSNTVLNFTSNSGITVTEYDGTDSIHIRDLTIGAGTTGGTALKFATQATSLNTSGVEENDVTGVSIGSVNGVPDLSRYWSTDLAIGGVSNITFGASSFSGGGFAHGIGVDLETPIPALIPIVFNFTNDSFWNINIGINYGSYVQGVTVSQCNFTGITKGIYLGFVTGAPTQLSVLNSQFASEVTTGAHDIEVDTPVNFTAIGNLLYVDSGGDGIYFGADPDPGIVTGNTFISSLFSPSSNVGVFIASAARGTVFTGNFFEDLQDGILLATGSSGILAANNTFVGNTTDIGDAGANNPKTYTNGGAAYWTSGTQSGQNPPAGYVGEYVSSAASGVGLSNGVVANITSVVLTPGDWDVTGTATISPTGTIQSAAAGINTTTSMPSVISSGHAFAQIVATDTATEQAIALMPSRVNVTTPTSVYCLESLQITSGSATGGCYLRARRWP